MSESASCLHCGTPFVPSLAQPCFCCQGCQYVHQLITHSGYEHFYSLKGSRLAQPVRSTPFVQQDFSWLAKAAAAAESECEKKGQASLQVAVEGVSCIGCVWLIERLFLEQSGAIAAEVDPTTASARLSWQPGQLELTHFASRLAQFGYLLQAFNPTTAPRSEARALATRLGLCAAFALNAMAFSLPHYAGMPADFPFASLFHLVAMASATLAMLVGAMWFIRRGFAALAKGVVHIDLPIALGLIAAYAGSLGGLLSNQPGLLYFDFVATFSFLMLVGRYVQVVALEKNQRQLRRRQPLASELTLAEDGHTCPLEKLAAGQRYLLQPGQTVPVCSRLERAESEFSLEWINGEATPQTWPPGRPIPAGAIHLGASPQVVSAMESWRDSLLWRIFQSHRQSPRVPALERLLACYLLAIIAIGLGSFAFHCLIGQGLTGLQRMISVFVVSCPCALGVALPFADELIHARLARLGVFLRRPLVLQRLLQTRYLLLDKTGTLTLERPVLQNPEALTALHADAKRALAVLTAASLHPVARSLYEALVSNYEAPSGEQLAQLEAPDIVDVPGCGRSVLLAGNLWSIGKAGWSPLLQAGSKLAPSAPHHHDTELRCNGSIIAHFHFREVLRPEARNCLDQLRAAGIRPVILSGDAPHKVANIAAKLDIPCSDAFGSLVPEEKARVVKQLDCANTLYLGDGANDALAFDKAHVAGSPLVDMSLLEKKADFLFFGSSLGFLPAMFELAVRRQRTVAIAFSFALLYNLGAVGAALMGWMNPLVAAIIMPLSSLASLLIVSLGLRSHANQCSKSAAALPSPIWQPNFQRKHDNVPSAKCLPPARSRPHASF